MKGVPAVKIRARARKAPARPALFLESTDAVANYVEPPSGIPRFERFMLREALADPDVKVLCREGEGFRELAGPEQEGILGFSEDFAETALGLPPWRCWMAVLARIRSHPLGRNSADRYYARVLCRRLGRGWPFGPLKLFFRAYRFYRRSLRARRDPDRVAQRADLGQGILLMDDSTLNGVRLQQVMAHAPRRAFVCHDLIPIFHPEYLDDPAVSGRFRENLDRLLDSPGTTVLCTSRTSLDMVRRYGKGRARLGRFPLPSTLYEKAASIGRSARRIPEEPYVLYCSTVEVRKNHLLLARLWHRALGEGRPLPKLVCAGHWGWGIGPLREYLAAHPALAGHIRFTGQLEDGELIDLYRGALFGVMPSKMEGWGMGASECLDFGVPVLVSDIPALREATRGLMPALPPEDEEAWYGALRRLAEDAAYRKKLEARIARSYRPVPAARSWRAIKRELRGG